MVDPFKMGRKKGKKTKQSFTTPPKKDMGKKKTAGHDMGNTFATQPKKSEADKQPRTRGAERSARMQRLKNKFI